MCRINVQLGRSVNYGSKIIKSVIRKKLGVEADVQFNDPISVTFDGENANVHVNVNATLGRDDLDKLLKDLI